MFKQECLLGPKLYPSRENKKRTTRQGRRALPQLRQKAPEELKCGAMEMKTQGVVHPHKLVTNTVGGRRR